MTLEYEKYGEDGAELELFGHAEPENRRPDKLDNKCYAEGDCGCCKVEAESNTVEIRVLRPRLKLYESAEPDAVCRDGQAVVLKIVAKNEGDAAIDDIVVYDKLKKNLRYVPGSTRIDNGAPFNCDPDHGVELGCLTPGQHRTVCFAVTVCL